MERLTPYTPPDEAILTAMTMAHVSAVQYGRPVPLSGDEKHLIRATLRAVLLLCEVKVK